ncbi:glutathione S-transferase family protein [Methylobacterium sp. BTF04]|uniref:glutathione S-transferase family protein n=1 Tax=Methylobacterium sp. BTF04 TaxID=2708300 RepID=UPI0013D66CD7|nr:glutathione S-transferase family protein [Methylobacterium sp. BTF04]NEU11015.1 glutathione S-transferase family protein [Methylobacterium sp. BTF04]
MNSEITFYHSPNTRSSGVRILLEELGAPHQLHVLNMKAGENRAPAFLAVNPLGKVPALTHGDALVTEQAAIYLYLADLFPEKGLAPAISDPLRGPYLRWMVYYGSSFEPAVIDRAMQREPGPKAMSAYGDFDTVLATLVETLSKGPYLLGERFSAADVLWGTALAWTTSFKLVPEEPVIMAYIARAQARPAMRKMMAEDAAIAAEHEAAMAAVAEANPS